LARFDIDKNIIEIAQITSNQNQYIITDILLHELCHWYCHKVGLNDHDFSRDFENELIKIGSCSSKSTSVQDNKILYYRMISCSKEKDMEISISGFDEYVPTDNVKNLADSFNII
jgi:predicted SprT family Zn-dependent metalloprotease